MNSVDISRNLYDLNKGFNFNNAMMRIMQAETKQQTDSIARTVRGEMEKLDQLASENQDILNKMEDIVELASDKSDRFEVNQRIAVVDRTATAGREFAKRSEEIGSTFSILL